jgi:hypothetical protein
MALTVASSHSTFLRKNFRAVVGAVRELAAAHDRLSPAVHGR